MTKWRYIFWSVVVFSTALVAAAFAPAISQQRNSSTYMISSSEGQYVWRVNISDGSVSYCIRDSIASSQSAVSNQKPFCSNSSGPAGH